MLFHWLNHTEIWSVPPASAPSTMSASMRNLVGSPPSFSTRFPLARLSTRLAFRVMILKDDMPKLYPFRFWLAWIHTGPRLVVPVG